MDVTGRNGRARRALARSALGVGLAVSIATGAGLGSASSVAVPLDTEQECDPVIPAQIVSPLQPEAASRPIVLSVLVLLDRGVAIDQATSVMKQVAVAYRPLDIVVQARYRRVSMTGTDVDDLLAQAKGYVGGSRPRGFDIVHTLTRVDVTDEGGNDIVGLADCIGGVRYPDRAFSVNEVTPTLRDASVGPLVYASDQVAATAAHELGHLLGGRHEHANCGEGVQEPTKPNPCTVMTLLGPHSNVFGRLESAVLKGYARAYAAP